MNTLKRRKPAVVALLGLMLIAQCCCCIVPLRLRVEQDLNRPSTSLSAAPVTASACEQAAAPATWMSRVQASSLALVARPQAVALPCSPAPR